MVNINDILKLRKRKSEFLIKLSSSKGSTMEGYLYMELIK